EAPAHRNRRHLLHDVHLIDPAVTGDATDAVVHVGAVVEEDVIGEVVDLDPVDRPAAGEAVKDGLEPVIGLVGIFLVVVSDDGVAVHAYLCGRDGGEGGLLDGAVTVTTIQAERTGVHRVVGGHGWFGGVTDGD